MTVLAKKIPGSSRCRAGASADYSPASTPMATNSEQPPVPTVPADTHFDERAGIYGFFRRHQRKLLYTVGLFTLLTFSVGGPMLAAVRELFQTTQPMPTIEVGGQRVALTKEDYLYGQALARSSRVLMLVLSMVDAGEGGQNELGDVYAILRRAAITEGFDASMVEVDRAIEALRDRSKLSSAAQVASQFQFASLAEYRTLMREAMRIGQMVRLQTLMLDNSDAAVLHEVRVDKEKITFHVASFDEKALEEQQKAAGGLTDEDLRKWLDAKTDGEKYRIQAFDTNRVALKIGAAMQADFDAAEWQDEALKDFAVGEEQLKKAYEQEKENRFKLEDKTYKPITDEAVKAEVTKLLQIDQVMNFLLGKIREQQNAALESVNAEFRKTIEELNSSQNALTQAKVAHTEAITKAAEKPDDQALKDAVVAAETEMRQAQESMMARENAKKSADEAVKAARAGFDFQAAFTGLTKDKKGFVLKATEGKKNAEELKDLDANDVGLGQWSLSVQATYLQNKGDLSNQPTRSSKATFLFQIADIDVRPLKPWDKLKPLVEGAYYTEKAKTEGEEKKKIMESSLLELAKARMPEKVAEIEGKREAAIAEKLAAWTARTEKELAAAKEQVAKLPPETQAGVAWTKKRDLLDAQLQKVDEKKKEIELEVQKQIETDIATEAKKHHDEVLAEAAAKAGFTVDVVGPYSRELQNKPRFDKAYDPKVVYLFRNYAQSKAGESTGIVRDEAKRLWLVACCTKVEPLGPEDVDRRDFEQLRKGYGFTSYASVRSMMAQSQAFTKAALEKRYAYQSAIGQQSTDLAPVKEQPKTPK
jgi:hypothetical protein